MWRLLQDVHQSLEAPVKSALERLVLAGSGAGGRLLWSIIISQNHKYLEDPKPCLNTLPGKPVEVIALQVGNPTTGGRQRQAACCIAFTGERV